MLKLRPVKAIFLNRYNGYTDALKKYSDTTSVIFLEESLHGDKLKTARRLFTKKIITSLPDVIITSNDLIAQGIIKVPHMKTKLTFQTICKITGFDDSLSSAYFIPSVTTVSQNIDELAKRCFSMLMDLINKKNSFFDNRTKHYFKKLRKNQHIK